MARKRDPREMTRTKEGRTWFSRPDKLSAFWHVTAWIGFWIGYVRPDPLHSSWAFHPCGNLGSISKQTMQDIVAFIARLEGIDA
jgi:hypothetical protein